MRAARLLAILMLLQSRGRVTAQALAAELEVSVRTIYRDLDALSAAGVPVYAQRGPGGGCALLDSYRTTLTGLTDNEVRALFMVSIPAPLTELGVSDELRMAMLKLAAALPAAQRGGEAQVRQRVHLDAAPWADSIQLLPHLRAIHRAVWQDRCLVLTLQLPFETSVETEVEPYGLVAKGGGWYLVCRRSGQVQVLRVADVLAAQLTEQRFQRPRDFDLADFWQQWSVAYRASRPNYRVTARISPALRPVLPHSLDAGIEVSPGGVGPPDQEGWTTLTLSFESLEEARRLLLALGGAVEVLAPKALRLSMADFAQQIASRYDPLG